MFPRMRDVGASDHLNPLLVAPLLYENKQKNFQLYGRFASDPAEAEPQTPCYRLAIRSPASHGSATGEKYV